METHKSATLEREAKRLRRGHNQTATSDMRTSDLADLDMEADNLGNGNKHIGNLRHGKFKHGCWHGQGHKHVGNVRQVNQTILDVNAIKTKTINVKNAESIFRLGSRHMEQANLQP